MASEGGKILGGCHCGNLTFEMASARPPEALPLRTCGCGFCRLHGGRYTSDPEGFVRFTARDPAQVARYRFGHGTADFLICRTCGGFLGAFMREGERGYAVVNVNACERPERFGREAPVMDYEAEDETDRLARRRARWTPAAFVEADGAGAEDHLATRET